MKADLHIHTKESDGCLTVEEVVKTASEQGLEVIAITDHDTTDGVEKAIETASIYGIRVIPGVEIFTCYQEEEIHLLAYYKDINNDRLQNKLKQIREDRTHITEQMVKKLQDNGIDIGWEEVRRVASCQGAICKTHIMYAIKNHVKQPKSLDWNTISSWFRPGGIAYIPYGGSPFQEAVDLVLSTGGIPVLAHPGLIKNKSIIHDLLSYRPIGLEVYYAYWEHSEETVAFYEEVSKSAAVLTTGGSDYHGFFSPVGIGQVDIPNNCVIGLKEYLQIDL